MLTRGRITNSEAGNVTSSALVGEDEEAIAGGLEIAGTLKAEYGLELALGGQVIEGVEVLVVGAAVFGSADCRGGITADAIGWLKSGADGRWWIRERASALRSTHEEHTSTPRSTRKS